MVMKQMARYINPLVVVAALGYFVDIYDLILFSIVRIPSLVDMGVASSDVTSVGVMLLNTQMIGMLVGGVLWGVLGDRLGRVSVLFGSILMYSVANLANGLIDTVPAYAVWRFIAGVGLAGELGVGITLAAETLPKETRGWGTMAIATFGVSGAILAGVVAEWVNWRACYVVGGVMGLLLLLLRVKAYESGLFTSQSHSGVARGQFFALFSNGKRLIKYLACIVVGLPTWFVIGVLVTFSPELAKGFGVTEPVSAGKAVLMAYVGLVIGDLASGLLSQWWQSRRLVFVFFILLGVLATAWYGYGGIQTAAGMYGACLILGISVGYWAIFVTNAAEQFGTNLRATVATTVPNFIRASVVPLLLIFQMGYHRMPASHLCMIMGGGCALLALGAVWLLPETFGKELDYVE